ncbi:enoyl-CoA hydratase/isomerase family protein [Plantactinospora endophytica]|uniref:Enoyl-CoA hydratase n=1 Tax=Plantactinospora endophytica TaxID=673535 RepID=A0ABQ4E1Y0_9ACTN|nr:enoyl-CoA hydratase/isomerase family protein [Plantactinospora endophytica]GIG88713.1 enoyl-CoA hydratase [Plantactinospora endophytica]
MAQVNLTKKSPSFWCVSLDNPPVNVFGAQMVIEMRALLDAAENDPELTVIVFESANPDYFIAHWDLADDLSALADQPPPVTGQQPFVDIMVRLSRLPVLTISKIRGRARGAGSEFLLATDIRFASRERTLIGQFEMGAGSVPPGGGAPARLPRLVGRGRALEILVGAEDFDGDLAERYGYVNRAVPDVQLDEFVTAFASRVATVDRSALADLKGWVNAITLPDDSEFPPQSDSFAARLGTPRYQNWAKSAFAAGLQQSGDLEERLGTRSVEL